MRRRFFLLLFLFGAQSIEAEEREFSFQDPYVISAKETEENQSLRSFLNEDFDFNYFEEEALIGNSSLFYKGLDQRHLDIKYEGFVLQDPSSPLGVVDVSTFSDLRGVRIEQEKSTGLDFKIKSKTQNAVFLGGSQLREFRVGSNFSSKFRRHNINSSSSLSRLGAYNFATTGSERDEVRNLSLDLELESKLSENKKNEVFFLHVLKRGEEDAFSIQEGRLADDVDARFKTSVLMLGERYYLSQNQSLGVSYTRSQKQFLNFGVQDVDFLGETVELQARRKNLLLSLIRESNELWYDVGGDLSFDKTRWSLKALHRKERGSALQAEVFLYKRALSLYYKELLPSLFQIQYNAQRGLENFETQHTYGLSFEDYYKLGQSLNLTFKAFYQNAQNLIDYDFLSDTYIARGHTENLFSSLELDYKRSSFFVRAQRAKDRGLNQDLPRRSRWSYGANLYQRYGDVNLNFKVSWHSSRRAFDQTKLSNFWRTSFKAKYKKFSLLVSNVLDQDTVVFKGLARRPFRVFLEYTHPLGPKPR